MTDEQENDALEAEAWARRADQCRGAIARLGWLVGSWRGHGTHGGSPRVCEVETRLLFDGSFLESRERIYTADGVLEHEDLTIYVADPDAGHASFWATAYIRGGLAIRYKVHASGNEIVCEPEMFGARLAIQRVDGGYRVRIFYPNDDGGWIEDAVVEYEPRE